MKAYNAPLMTTVNDDFVQFGLDPSLLRALAELGYTTPTPIQQKAIPIALAGRDLMGAAQTGTGKTAGFALPILQMLMPHQNTGASPARHPVRALMLAPTRELADQIYDNVRAYARHTHLRCTVIFGGMDMNPQTEALRSGVEIVIATPGRLLDHVQQKSINLSNTQVLVLDEADRMLDMGFMPDLQRIINLLPHHRQNLMFSATFSEEIKKLARSFMRDPALVEVAQRNSTADNVTQLVYSLAEDDKRRALLHLVQAHKLEQLIVFVNTKLGASRLARQLEREGLSATAIHGDRSQSERLKALDDFKSGQVKVLVATDVAARGLDIPAMPCVVNYDVPHNAEDYVHRIGRTGRAGATGLAVTLASHDEERSLVDIEKLIKRSLGRGSLNLESSSSGASSRGAMPTNSRRSMTPAPPRPAVDEWFCKPYEPSVTSSVSKTSTAATQDASAQTSSVVGIKRAKPTARGLGTLLSGSKK